MHMKAKRPVLVPKEFVAELDKLSKAALMDLAYDLAATQSTCAEDPGAVMTALRERVATVQVHRQHATSYYEQIKARSSERGSARVAALSALLVLGLAWLSFLDPVEGVPDPPLRDNAPHWCSDPDYPRGDMWYEHCAEGTP